MELYSIHRRNDAGPSREAARHGRPHDDDDAQAANHAKRANPPLHVTPLVKETTGPRLTFRIGMGVRGADQNWKRLLNRLIQENQPAINKILLDYGVPLLDENDRPLGSETATKLP